MPKWPKTTIGKTFDCIQDKKGKKNMNFDKYTIKSQEVLQKAAEVAQGNQQQAIEPGHLMKAILVSDENVVTFIFNKLNVNREHFEDKLEDIVNGYPKVSGSQPYLSNDSATVLSNAEKTLKDFGDEYIAVEHILLGILEGKEKVSQLTKRFRF